MKIVLINATQRKGSTYSIAQLLIQNLHPEAVQEFFLPKDAPHFCIGCGTCFMKGEEHCPHASTVQPIMRAIEEADVVIFASPVYVFHTTGQLKALLDHYGYQWFVHRPNPKLFEKTAVVISTAAGGGMKSTNKDIKDSLDFWGVGKIYTYGKGVQALYGWDGVPQKIRDKVTSDMEHLSQVIHRRGTKASMRLKSRMFFYVMRLLNKRGGLSKMDHDHWEKQGWLGKKRPWKT